MAIIARAIRTITDLFDPIQQGTAPASPVTGMLWLDTSLTPNQLKRWTGTAWVTVNDPAGILTRLDTAEQKITPSAIVSTVRSSSEYLGDLAGKNRTWLQSTAPTGANVGDLWIDTTNGNLLKRWNGSSWANVQDAAVSIAQQTADKISWIVASGSSASNMTLTSQLYSLVSQNVVITADNLTATARDTLKLEAAEAIQVGGTNLLRNSDFTDGFNYWTNYSASTLGWHSTIKMSGTKAAATITTPAVAGDYSGMYQEIPYIANVEHDCVLSVWHYRTAAFVANHGTNPLGVIQCVDSGGAIIGTKNLRMADFPDINYSWQRGHASLTLPASTALVRIYLYVFGVAGASTQWIISNVQFEKGTVPSAWSASPDDPVRALKSSSVIVNDDGIFMDTTGDFNLNAGVGVNIRGGTGTTSIGMSNNYPTTDDKYFLWAGNAAPASAPFSVKMNGDIIAKNLTHVFTTTFSDTGDPGYPAICRIYVPTGCTVEQALVSFKLSKYRAYTASGISEPFAAPAGVGLYTMYAEDPAEYLYSNWPNNNHIENADITNMMWPGQWNILVFKLHTLGEIRGSVFIKLKIS